MCENQEICQIRNKIARQLLEARMRAHLSLEQVSQMTGIPVNKLDKLEVGIKQPDVGHLYYLAKVYHKKVEINLVD